MEHRASVEIVNSGAIDDRDVSVSSLTWDQPSGEAEFQPPLTATWNLAVNALTL